MKARFRAWIGGDPAYGLLPQAERRVLKAIADGWTLRSQRFLDGRKLYFLHALSGEKEAVAPSVVQGLLRRGLVQSNQKFPVATYLLTDRGRRLLRLLGDVAPGPISARNFDPPQQAPPSSTRDTAHE